MIFEKIEKKEKIKKVRIIRRALVRFLKKKYSWRGVISQKVDGGVGVWCKKKRKITLILKKKIIL